MASPSDVTPDGATHIKYHIEPRLIRSILLRQVGEEVLPLVIDDLVSSQRGADHIEARLGARGDYVSSQVSSNLNCCDSYSSCTTCNEDSGASLDFSDFTQSCVRRDCSQGDRGCLVEV